MNALPLQTPPLVLRHFVPEDAAQILALNGEPSTREWIPSQVYENLAEAQGTIDFLIAQYANPGDPRRGPYVLAVAQWAAQGDTDVLLGHVGFSELDGEVEVGYAIAESARGRGYGAQALSAACAWATQAFGLDRIVAVTAQANVSSRRTLERAGFAWERDETMRFQGRQQVVSRYRRTSKPSPN